MALDLDKSGRIPQTVATYLGPTVGWKYTDAPTDIEYVIGGSTDTFGIGYKGGLLIPDWLVINNWFITSPNPGSISIDVWLVSQANLLTGTVPSAANSICGGNYPVLTNQTAASGPPTGWNTNNGPSVPLTQINQNDFLGFNVRSTSNLTLVTFVLQCVRVIGPS
jgi:hypothetical protein